MAQNKVIQLSSSHAPVKERLAGGAVTPGHLVDLNSANAVVVHAVSGGYALPAFALENLARAGDLDSAYVSGETLRYVAPSRGDEIYAWVPAAGVAIVIGDRLMSNGAGALIKNAVPATIDGSTVARALEAVDNSGGAAAVRIKVEVV